MTYRFCFITYNYALYDFLQFSLRILVSSLSFQTSLKGCSAIRNLGISNDYQINLLCSLQCFFVESMLLIFHSLRIDKTPRQLSKKTILHFDLATSKTV
jgi:hypothetical protein